MKDQLLKKFDELYTAITIPENFVQYLSSNPQKDKFQTQSWFADESDCGLNKWVGKKGKWTAERFGSSDEIRLTNISTEEFLNTKYKYMKPFESNINTASKIVYVTSDGREFGSLKIAQRYEYQKHFEEAVEEPYYYQEDSDIYCIYSFDDFAKFVKDNESLVRAMLEDLK